MKCHISKVWDISVLPVHLCRRAFSITRSILQEIKNFPALHFNILSLNFRYSVISLATLNYQVFLTECFLRFQISRHFSDCFGLLCLIIILRVFQTSRLCLFATYNLISSLSGLCVSSTFVLKKI